MAARRMCTRVDTPKEVTPPRRRLQATRCRPSAQTTPTHHPRHGPDSEEVLVELVGRLHVAPVHDLALLAPVLALEVVGVEVVLLGELVERVRLVAARALTQGLGVVLEEAARLFDAPLVA